MMRARTTGTIARAAGACAVALLAAGCGDLVGPLAGLDLPELDPSLDPDRVSVGRTIATPCALGIHGDGFADRRNRDEWALVDIFFGRGPEEGPRDRPRPGEILMVEALGGRVLHTLHVPADCAYIRLSRLPDLVEEGPWTTVSDVPDPTRLDLSLSVLLTRPVRESDAGWLNRLGAWIRPRPVLGFGFPDRRDVSVIIPDRSVPALRKVNEVGVAEVSGFACIG